jgi:5-formyltetrahydrofolate cyclo-ligase
VTFHNNPATKQELRIFMRRLLREITLDSPRIRAAVAGWLTSHPDASTIAVFHALPGEVDLTEITRQHRNRRWVYPRIAGADLVFHHVNEPADDLVPGAMGILEPSADLPVIPTHEIDAFFCPGLAFDTRGGRLGRGKGFYDRLLSRSRPDALKIGICFPDQLVADTFAEAHDIPMDLVLTV